MTIKERKDELALVDVDAALKRITTLYKYDSITYSEFVELLNWLQRNHKPYYNS